MPLIQVEAPEFALNKNNQDAFMSRVSNGALNNDARDELVAEHGRNILDSCSDCSGTFSFTHTDFSTHHKENTNERLRI